LGMSRNQYLWNLISANAPGIPVRPKKLTFSLEIP